MLDRVHQRAGAFVDDMDFGALYDERRDVFIGFNVDRGALDNNYYDLAGLGGAPGQPGRHRQT
ncbi:MAG: hypothetical protein R2851_03640 [Caldilineaceae bacterium]